jgi:type VI secretion system secreted protein VgrG
MPEFTQANRQLRLTTPLGPDALLMVGLTGREAISELFTYHLDTLAQPGVDVDFSALLGLPISVQVDLPGRKTRFIHGICHRISEGGDAGSADAYQLHLVPQLWFLTQRSQSRVFQHLSVPDILKQMFAGIDVKFELEGTFQQRDYCVQYRETDFHFVSRLMEEEGIFYFFKHAAGGHTMVVANAVQSHSDVPFASTIIFDNVDGGNRDEDRINLWTKTQEVRSGKYTLFDHTFELPHKHLEAEKTIQATVQVGKVTHKLNGATNRNLELFDYPGEYAQRFDGVNRGGGEQPAELKKIFEDNTRTATIRMQEEAVPALTVQGASDCRQFTAGHAFTLTRHGKGDGKYVLTTVEHTAYEVDDYRSGGGGATYANAFTCIPVGLPFRPPRTTAKPVIPGTQTAVVVGPKGQEIFTDKYGRVKVQFHWDRLGKNDADSSCWVRVAQIWSGKRWGSSFVPRIGQEVVVAFEEGDPDRPIIVGSVYNADQMPPYLGEGPDGKHKNDPKVSGVKTNTTPGGVGFNELRFDDTKGKEQVFVHGEKDMDLRVKNDRRELVLHDAHLIVGSEKDGKKVGDQRELVHQNKHLRIKGSQVEKIDGNLALTVGKGDAPDGGNVDIVIGKNRREFVEKDTDLHVKGVSRTRVEKDHSLLVQGDKYELLKKKSHVHVMSDRREKVDGTQSLTVGGNQQESVAGNHALEAAQEVHIKAGTTLILEAGMQLTLKVGGNFIDISPAGVSIQGTMVLINSGGAAGSGSGAQPLAPDEALVVEEAVEANPTKPDVADDAVTGIKSAP